MTGSRFKTQGRVDSSSRRTIFLDSGPQAIILVSPHMKTVVLRGKTGASQRVRFLGVSTFV